MYEFSDVRVVVADSHPAMLLTARTLLEQSYGVEVIATVGDLPRATRIAAEANADVLVLDLNMLGGSSRTMIADLRRQLPDTQVVILTMEASPAFVPAVLGAGACAYVLKEFAEADLAEAVREAALGHRFVSEKIAA